MNSSSATTECRPQGGLQSVVRVRLVNVSISANPAELRSKVSAGVVQGHGVVLDISAVEKCPPPSGCDSLSSSQPRHPKLAVHGDGSPVAPPAPPALVRPGRRGTCGWLVSRVVGSALINRRSDERWSVTCIEYRSGLALLLGPALTRVIVADSTHTFAGPHDSHSHSAAVCTRDGELALVVHHSPPALVLGRTACRTLPADGARCECVPIDPGERLRLLSSAAFESMPEVLANGIANVPTDLDTQNPEILEQLDHPRSRHFRTVRRAPQCGRLPTPGSLAASVVSARRVRGNHRPRRLRRRRRGDR